MDLTPIPILSVSFTSCGTPHQLFVKIHSLSWDVGILFAQLFEHAVPDTMSSSYVCLMNDDTQIRPPKQQNTVVDPLDHQGFLISFSISSHCKTSSVSKHTHTHTHTHTYTHTHTRQDCVPVERELDWWRQVQIISFTATGPRANKQQVVSIN